VNAEIMMDAIGGIRDEYIEQYAVVTPVKRNCISKMIGGRRWIYRLGVCAAAMALAVGIGMYSSRHSTSVSPFVLTAYALTDDGRVSEQELTSSIQMPVSLLKNEDGDMGFLFSIDSADADRTGKIEIITDGDSEEKAVDWCQIAGVQLDPEKTYFFCVGKNMEDIQNVSFCYSDDKTGSTYKITVQVTKTDQGYSAILQRLDAYPTKVKSIFR